MVMVTTFDISRLSTQQVADLLNDGKDLHSFKNRLLPIAASIPDAVNPKERDKQLKEAVREVMNEWEKHKKSLPRFAIDALVDTSKVKMPSLVSTLMGGATGWLLGASVGLAIGLVTYSGIKIWRKYQVNLSSPFQYLSRIEKAGASLVLPPLVARP